MFEQQPIKTSISLAKSENELKPNHMYMVDFSKLNSVNDLVTILAAMSIAFPSEHPHIGLLKPFLNTDNPIPLPGQQTQPVQSDLKLPKLKTLK